MRWLSREAGQPPGVAELGKATMTMTVKRRTQRGIWKSVSS